MTPIEGRDSALDSSSVLAIQSKDYRHVLSVHILTLVERLLPFLPVIRCNGPHISSVHCVSRVCSICSRQWRLADGHSRGRRPGRNHNYSAFRYWFCEQILGDSIRSISSRKI